MVYRLRGIKISNSIPITIWTKFHFKKVSVSCMKSSSLAKPETRNSLLFDSNRVAGFSTTFTVDKLSATIYHLEATIYHLSSKI